MPGKTTIKTDSICDKEFNCTLINCRSLKPKIKSLVETIKMNKLSVTLLNETWLYKLDKKGKKQLQEMRDEFGFDIIRRDRNS